MQEFSSYRSRASLYMHEINHGRLRRSRWFRYSRGNRFEMLDYDVRLKFDASLLSSRQQRQSVSPYRATSQSNFHVTSHMFGRWLGSGLQQSFINVQTLSFKPRWKTTGSAGRVGTSLFATFRRAKASGTSLNGNRPVYIYHDLSD